MRPFEAYTWQHLLPLVFFSLAGFLLIRNAKGWSERTQTRVGFITSLIVLAFMVGGSIIKLSRGTFDYTDDLPLYLCRLIAWALPVVMWYRNKFWAGIFYFWVLAGTLQGLITPDLAEGFPDYFYFRYWVLHAGLVIATLYAVLVFKVQIKWQHFWLAIGFAQVYIIIIHIINVAIGSNYSYTIRKPPGSILDFMGPWPWYILAGEGVMVILFLLLMIPWRQRLSR
jgi:hypothetical integral membrane protein (TIGR02206 family)